MIFKQIIAIALGASLGLLCTAIVPQSKLLVIFMTILGCVIGNMIFLLLDRPGIEWKKVEIPRDELDLNENERIH